MVISTKPQTTMPMRMPMRMPMAMPTQSSRMASKMSNSSGQDGGSKTKKSSQKNSKSEKSHSKSQPKSKKSKKVKMPKGYAYCMNPKCRKQVKMLNEKTKTTKNGRSLLYGEGSCGHQVFRFA